MTSPRLQAVLFDLDGTLVDSLPTIAQAMAEAVRLHGLDANPDEIVPLIGAPMNLLVEEIYRVPRDVADAINVDYQRIYMDSYIQRTPPHEGAERLLHSLRDQGVRLAVVTNKSERGGRRMVDVQDWNDLFEVVSGRDTANFAKPHPEAALSVLRRMGVTVEAAAFVGDTEFDMNCARDAGFPIVIALEGGRTAEHLRREGATHVVTHLDDVAPILAGVEVAR